MVPALQLQVAVVPGKPHGCLHWGVQMAHFRVTSSGDSELLGLIRTHGTGESRELLAACVSLSSVKMDTL